MYNYLSFKKETPHTQKKKWIGDCLPRQHVRYHTMSSQPILSWFPMTWLTLVGKITGNEKSTLVNLSLFQRRKWKWNAIQLQLFSVMCRQLWARANRNKINVSAQSRDDGWDISAVMFKIALTCQSANRLGEEVEWENQVFPHSEPRSVIVKMDEYGFKAQL